MTRAMEWNINLVGQMFYDAGHASIAGHKAHTDCDCLILAKEHVKIKIYSRNEPVRIVAYSPAHRHMESESIFNDLRKAA